MGSYAKGWTDKQLLDNSQFLRKIEVEGCNAFQVNALKHFDKWYRECIYAQSHVGNDVPRAAGNA